MQQWVKKAVDKNNFANTAAQGQHVPVAHQ
jgi:hypothetical protein